MFRVGVVTLCVMLLTVMMYETISVGAGMIDLMDAELDDAIETIRNSGTAAS